MFQHFQKSNLQDDDYQLNEQSFVVLSRERLH